MVAFCHQCSQSLPFADVIIEDGQEEPAPGYRCPHCEKLANQKADSSTSDESEGKSIPEQLIIKDGKILKPSES